jgi:cobalt/nickel transport system ATP-binding protein
MDRWIKRPFITEIEPVHVIKLNNICFSYSDGRQILDHLSFELHDGERVGLVGPNGSGKTTLFHVIMGLLRPDTGNIKIFGRERREEKDFRAVRQRIGLLFQDADDQLFSPTVLEDVAFGPLNQGKTVKEAKRTALETLSVLGLDNFENRITHKLSGGEKRLVSLATVLAMKPKVLLLDEPTAGLDSHTTQKITDILCGMEMASVFISHDMTFLYRTTKKIYGMENGRINAEPPMVPHPHVHIHECGHINHIHEENLKK